MNRVAIIGALLLVPSLAFGEYIVGPGDVLQVSVWQHADLDRTIPVRIDGNITFPPVGDVQATGLTTEELATRLEEQLFAYTRGTTKVTVAVAQFNSKYVVVTGAVGSPGRYAFERIPNLFEIIGIAGGGLPGARLGEIEVVRSSAGRVETFSVDLNAYMDGRDPGRLAELAPGDVIYVPGSGIGDPTALGTATPGATTISVLGAVGRPGTYEVQRSFALPEVVGLAGGLRPDADLRSIKVLSREPDGTEFVATLDLEEIFRAGEPVRFPIRPGDAIYVSPREPGLVTTLTRGALSALSLSRDILNFVVLFDVLKNNDNNN